ncbi:hypothetical protein E1B28_005941 [Marasmius oreades]|uniref:Uncharacterized protein n=1 Tax=Marasmius oreades TaxID=181124 RepID=A0A9P7UUS0_9AGAR|nr:uncharacterized protein E1B28_005941 [Marasmius oreades]KAG7095162.1 hypothetical protein E1B28_005941 [Marasmius oreades]
MRYLAEIPLNLQRQLEAYELACAAQITAFSSAQALSQDILESQRLLHLVGHDPVSVLQGLLEDANFELSPDHLKMLAGALGWPLPLVADSSVHRWDNDRFILTSPDNIVLAEAQVPGPSQLPPLPVIPSSVLLESFHPSLSAKYDC